MSINEYTGLGWDLALDWHWIGWFWQKTQGSCFACTVCSLLLLATHMHNLIEELTCKFELSYSTEWYYGVKYTQRRFKIQDHFIISSEKLKRGWTLTTSQYTVTHIWYFTTKEQLLKIQKLRNKQTSKLRNLHTHTHTHCYDVWTDLSVQKCYWLYFI